MVDPNANLIFGAVVGNDMADAVSITIIATGFGEQEPQLGALRRAQAAAAQAPAAAAAAPAAASQPAAAPAAPAAAPVAPAQEAQSADSGSGNGLGIEIPAFLRRRRLQGK